MYEPRHKPPLTRARFARRLLGHSAVVVGLIVASLGLGMWGYVGFEHLSCIDAFLNAASSRGASRNGLTPSSATVPVVGGSSAPST